ncbi:D-allose transporter substrate-binding protein [Caloramator sp. E03]|uniref:D-allose transporter substrate-binding protein n=1 Tax=Caloramator sp. E03 TaxID=2576307 RepID=UPI0011108A47|nr:D-allose transporter substrate-binding protein [Caloramator sp. E03]QCX34025.1 D-allose transporter substrate-binding protein [Caloramator sp. E03]
MKHFKKLTLIASMIVLIISLFSSCSKKESSTSTQSTQTQQQTSDNAQIAIVLKTLSNPFWVTMKEGIEAEAKAQGIKVDIFAASSEEDVQEQLKLVENLLNKDYKAIGVAPLSPVNLIPAVVEANKKGMYVVNIDEKIDMNELKNAGGSVIAFVTTDNEKVGAKGAQYIVDTLGAQGGEVAIIEGKAGNASGEARKKGAAGVFNSNSLIKLVASQPADWDRSKALDVATNMLQRNPNIKAFYCCNDTMALGVMQAVQNVGKEGKILVVGTDGTPEAVQAVKDGKMAATVAQDPAKIGATSLQLLIKALKDKPQISVDKEPEFITVDSNLIKK